MIIKCEKCGAKFTIDDSRIKSSGSKVRCSKCGNVFLVAKEEEAIIELEEDVTPAPEIRQEEKPKETHQDSYPDLKELEKRAFRNVNPIEEPVREKKSPIVIEDSPKTKNDPDFNWDRLKLDEAIANRSEIEPKKLFADTPKELQSRKEARIDVATSRKSEPDRLSVNKEKLFNSDIRKDVELSYSPSSKKIDLRATELEESSLKKISSALIAAFVVIIIAAAGFYALTKLGVISKDKFRAADGLLSKLSGNSDSLPRNAVVISEQSGRWANTKDGLIYLVSGKVTNKWKYPVNYIKVNAAFFSDEKRLSEQSVYAGNTLTDLELRTLSLKVIQLKLNRQNGDLDFNNPDKLAGLNYDIQPGQSIPFFAVFPSNTKIFGLKYEVNVSGFERAQAH